MSEDDESFQGFTEEDIKTADVMNKARAKGVKTNNGGKGKTRQRQPPVDVRVHGYHFPIKSKLLKDCRLSGCTRRTTCKCANVECQMNLCFDKTGSVYEDTKPDECSLEQMNFLASVPQNERSCFLVYHCMDRPKPAKTGNA
jgi:hypothetical protein